MLGIKEYQEKVDHWIKVFGVRYFDEQTNTILLMEEVGELARLMARVYGEQSFKDPKDKIKAQSNIKEEISDIIFVITCISNQLNINLEKVLLENLTKKTNRDKDRHRKNQKLK